jgi:hypothetical protein
MKTEQDYYQIADLTVAAWLLTHKIPFRGAVLSSDGYYATLQFKPDDRIVDLVDAFNAGEACSARDFAANYRFLAVQSKQARRSGGGR